MKIKVLFSSSGLKGTYGGSAFSEALLSSHLQRLADLTVLCAEHRLDDTFARRYGISKMVTYRRLDPFLAWLFPFHSLNKLCSEADVFHLNGHWKLENYFLTRLCRRFHVPYVLHPRGMLLVGHRSLVKKRLFNFLLGNTIVRGARRVIALSHFEKRHFRPYRLAAGAIEVIANPIVEERYPAESETGSKKKEPYFLYIGRIEKRKNLVFLVDGFYRYLKWGGDGILVCVGPVERRYDKDLRAHAEMLGISERVLVKPPVFASEKDALIRKSRAVIYPSFEEPFGRVPFEAIMAGTLPLIPDASGSAEYLKPLLPQCIYHAESVDSLSAALEAVTRSRHSDALKAAQKWVRSELDPDHIANQVFEMYEYLLSGQAKPQVVARKKPVA